VLLLVLALSANVAFAQACKKICKTKITNCEPKNIYVLNGDLIEATLYHENGKVAQTGFYTLENKLHGEWISYNDNGEKTAVASYDNGAKVGTWVFFHGDTMKEVSYESSKIAEVKTWTVTDTKVVVN
ncbi:MAG: hypothetical protein AAF466_08500, partial [Bacteroidota bacterium]